MKLFTPKDFIKGETEEGLVYHNCVMLTGTEIQVEALPWGFQIGIYNMFGRLMLQTRQPYLITMAGGVDYDLSHELMLMEVSKLYDKSLSIKQITVN